MPPGFCTEYDITNNNGYTVTINYTPCDGSATSFDLAGGASTTVCADSLGIPETDGGIDPSVDIEEGGSCTASASPTPSRTPSNTPAAASVSRTPSVTVTRTVTPSITRTPSNTPPPSPANSAITIFTSVSSWSRLVPGDSDPGEACNVVGDTNYDYAVTLVKSSGGSSSAPEVGDRILQSGNAIKKDTLV